MRLVHLVFTLFISSSVPQQDPCITSTDTSLTCMSFQESLRKQLNISHEMVPLINVSTSSNCFILIKLPKSWDDAQQICKQASSRLAWVAHSNGTQDFGLIQHLQVALPKFTRAQDLRYLAWNGLIKENTREELYWDCPYKTGTDLGSGKKFVTSEPKTCGYINRILKNTLIDGRCRVPLHFYCELVLPSPNNTTPSNTSQKSSTMVRSATLSLTDSSTDGSTADPAKVGSKLILYIVLGVLIGLVFLVFLALYLGILILKGKTEQRRLQLELLIKPRGPSGPVNVHSYFSTSTRASCTEYEAPESSDETVRNGLDEDSGSSREN